MAVGAQRRARMQHRAVRGGRLGAPFQGRDEFIAPYEVSDLTSGDGWSMAQEAPLIPPDPLPDALPYMAVPTDTSGATVSVQDLQQQQAQGVFANPQVPYQYTQDAASQAFQAQYNPTLAEQVAATNALKQFGMWSGGTSTVEALTAAGLLPDGTPAPTQTAATTSLVPSTSSAVTPASSSPAPAQSSWLTTLLAWLQSPISPGLAIPWYWVLIAAGAGLYLMRDEQ